TLQLSKQQNENILEEIVQPSVSPKKPYFLYAHLNMPHPPFFYDSLKRERPIDSIVNETRNHIYKPATYLSYLKYTNGIIENLVTDIQNKEKNNAVIVIIGDHGFRSNITKKEHLFANMNAIYIPDHLRKTPPPDSLSLVNEFRYVLNSMTRNEMKLLPDSSFVLTDHGSEMMIKND
ncbi:MAG: sulfatase-like hydrolase/transferase, partial [Bacteroidota bacterium]